MSMKGTIPFSPSWFCLCSISCGNLKSHKAQKTTGGSIERAGSTDCRLKAWLNCTSIISLRHLHVCIQVSIFVMVFAGHPTAVCRTSACGYCHREWYDGVTGRIINCTGTFTDRSVCVWVRLSVCLCLCMRHGSRVQGSWQLNCMWIKNISSQIQFSCQLPIFVYIC